MNNINDLKDNAISVSVGGQTQQPDKNRINITNSNQSPQREHSQKGIQTSNRTPDNTNNRMVIDMTDIAPVEPEKPEFVQIKKDLASSILEGEDSMFAKYKREKAAEMQDYLEKNQEEMEIAEISGERPEHHNVADNEYGDPILGDELGSMNQDNEDLNVDMVNSDTSNYQIQDEDLSEFIQDKPDKGEDMEEKIINNPSPVEDTVDLDEMIENMNNNTEEVVSEFVENTEDDKTDDIDIELESADADIDFNVDIEEEDQDESSDDQEVLNNLKRLATEKLKPAAQKIDISSFSVLKKPSSSTRLFQQQQVKAAKWVLPAQNSIVMMKEFLGSELESLREYSEDPSSLTDLSKRYRLIYDHIVSVKPSTFEAWIKSTPFSDVDHYFFAIYIASFKGVNYLPAECENEKCKETFLTDNINIMDMVKFENEKDKAKFTDLYRSEQVNPNKDGLFNTEIVPLSDKLAVSFKIPSIYSLFEIAALSDRAKEKFSSIIEYVPYIDNVYMIDVENHSLIPCGYKVYRDNTSKTVISKLNMLNKMLKTLTIDQFYPIRAYIRELDGKALSMSYIYPEINCPKCGSKIEEKPASAEELVFTRYQLGALVNTPLK